MNRLLLIPTLVLAMQLAAEEPSKSLPTWELPRSTPERQGISSTALRALVEAADAEIDALHGLVIVRHGHVVAEGWWSPCDAATPHMLYSLSKSFTSTAVGLAIAEGKLSLDDEVLKFFPEDAPDEPVANLRSMRVHDLLRMSTGHQSEPSLWRSAPETEPTSDSWTKRFLAHPVPFKPGTHFLYNTSGTYLLSAIVQKATGQSVLDYLGPRLLEPLGFERPTWTASPEGVSLGGFGFNARTGEIARFGQLYLQRGEWNGKRLLPAAWVDAATSLQTSNGSRPTSDWDQGYGYQFWRSRHGYRGDGAFGQYCIVLPEHDLVVAITAGVRDMQQVLDLLWDRLLPALEAAPLPENDAATRELRKKLGALRLRVPAGRSTTPMASKVSDRWYEIAANDRDVEAMSIHLDADAAELVTRTSSGETRTAIGIGAWNSSPGGFTNGLDRALSVPTSPRVAASGAWIADDAFTVKIVLPETPFSTILTFRFEDDRLTVDSEHHVAFGPRDVKTLVGKLQER